MKRISLLAFLAVFCVTSAQAANAVTEASTLSDLVSIESLLSAPSATIASGDLQARLFLPDIQKGFYRGTRFDWAGVVGSLRYRGHDYYVPWFRAMSHEVRDIVFTDIGPIASVNTAATGPVDEFRSADGALGYADAAPGGMFVKIGVGVLQRQDDKPYSAFQQYPLIDPGQRTHRVQRDRIVFTHIVADSGSGYSYRYIKTVRLLRDQPTMLIEHELQNTGKKPIATQVYNHNFLNIDGAGTQAGLELRTVFTIVPERKPDAQWTEINGNRVLYVGALTGDVSVSTPLTGYGDAVSDYDFHITDRARGAGLRITGDQPLSHLLLWSIKPVMAIEPYIRMLIQPKDKFRWSYRYTFESVFPIAR